MGGPRNCSGVRGGGPRQSDKKALTALFVCFFLVIGLVNTSQMVNFKETYHFKGSGGGPNLSRGSNFFRGWGGGGGGGGPIAYFL